MSPESCEGLIGKGLKLCWGSTNDHPEQRSWFANTSIKCEQQTEMKIQDSLQKIIQSRYHSSPIQCEHRTVSNIHFLQIFIKSTENSSPIHQHNVQTTASSIAGSQAVGVAADASLLCAAGASTRS